ncbi:TetR/AcrR family transcriptional regulator [Streptomonospora alba]|uniref:TetR/AcrR family transcriptional regulator n=1 Tax=Streptomonospora alba TaxID=183763 RepID=UPI00069C1F63|nr:TetR/AcrR family transcriptional regulator [Streptomonospora alba]
MPKVVDHDLRRRQVAQAMWEAIRKYGIEGASIRKVAAEAGISVGLVQHYFSTREQLEHFAMEHMIFSAQQRMAERVDTVGPPATSRSLLRQVLGDLTVPADEQRLAEYQVLLAFSLRSLQRPDIAAGLRTSDAELRRFVTEEIRGAKERGEVRPAVDPETETTLLLCFADGCGQRVLLGHLAPDDASAALDRVLDRIFTAPDDGAGTAPATPSPE